MLGWWPFNILLLSLIEIWYIELVDIWLVSHIIDSFLFHSEDPLLG